MGQTYNVELTYDQVCEIRSQFLLVIKEDKKTVDKLARMKQSVVDGDELPVGIEGQKRTLLGLLNMFQRELDVHIGIYQIFNAICDNVEPWTDGTEPTARDGINKIFGSKL